MWFDLYLLSAIIAAVAAWLVSPHFQSYDPPGDVVRGFCAVVAGALWPVILVGVAQVFVVRSIARRVRSARVETVELPPLVVAPEASLHP